jgi:hypothetical protein
MNRHGGSPAAAFWNGMMPFHAPTELATAQPAILRLCIPTRRLVMILISTALSRHDVRLMWVVLTYG